MTSELGAHGNVRATSGLPTGTVTFLFSDIEGSAQRWECDRAAMQHAVRRHDALMRAAIEAHGGYVFKTIGDAFCAVFWRSEEAMAAALHAQRALFAEDFSAVDGLRVRMALHTGTTDEREADYSVRRSIASHGCSRSGTADKCSSPARPPNSCKVKCRCKAACAISARTA